MNNWDKIRNVHIYTDIYTHTHKHTGIYIWCTYYSSLLHIQPMNRSETEWSTPDWGCLEDNRLALKHTSYCVKSLSCKHTLWFFTAWRGTLFAEPLHCKKLNRWDCLFWELDFFFLTIVLSCEFLLLWLCCYWTPRLHKLESISRKMDHECTERQVRVKFIIKCVSIIWVSVAARWELLDYSQTKWPSIIIAPLIF